MTSLLRILAPLAFILLGVASTQSGIAQSPLYGASCGCPDPMARDTVWVSDNEGAGVGSQVWTCDHLYVLTEQVFVNGGDTLVIEPGTAVLGVEGAGRSQIEFPVTFGDIGFIREVSFDVYPGALVVARGAFLDAQGTSSCPIQFSFLGDPLDGSVGVDVQGKWGGLGLCGSGQTNTLNLDLSFFDAPFFTTGIGTGEDRLEGIIDLSGQDREVYGSNADSLASSGNLKYLSIRHGSTNLGWTQFGNGNETDLLQLGACGSETVIEHIELLSSADDGLHILGGLVEVSHILSAFHAEDCFESDQSWSGSAQFLFGLQDTALAHATNPPGPSFLYDAEGDDLQDNNVDPSTEPYSLPVLSNMTLVSNGAPQAASYHSLPGGDWTNSVVHGVSDAGVEVQHYLTCDGFNAMLPTQYAFLSIRNWRVSGTVGSDEEVIPGRYNGNYGGQASLSSWLADSNNVVAPFLVDGSFDLAAGMLVDGLDPRPMEAGTVTSFYLPTDGRLDPVDHHGAFAPEIAPWFDGWSMLSAMGFFSGEVLEPSNGEGCMYVLACNYDAEAVLDDGSCEFTTCGGCTYEWACNYNIEALLDDGSCELLSCSGCTWEEADNYNPEAMYDNGTCTFPAESSCPADINNDFVVSTLDLLELLSSYGSFCTE